VTAPTATRPAETTPADPLRAAIARARAAAEHARRSRGLGDTGPEDPRIAAAELARGEPGDEGDIRAAQDAYEQQWNRQGGEF
jgi:hypothetical protein